LESSTSFCINIIRTNTFKSQNNNKIVNVNIQKPIPGKWQVSVVGDTVGDPFKDTAGPSLHVLIKLLSTITLVLAPLFI
jgi:Na+/H+-translocating membrane pyrophosphatase